MKQLVLKTVNKDMQARGGFQYPKLGKVVCPDWDPEPKCGGGLHGLLWGEGEGSLLDWSEDAVWLVLMVDSDKVVDLERKVKFPSCEVIYSGSKEEATSRILEMNAGAMCVGAVKNCGNYGTVIVGDYGKATAGEGGTAIAGYRGTATASYDGTATAGNYGAATAGHYGTTTAGEGGKATAGDNGKALAGHYGTATTGDGGIATAGDRGTATTGDCGTATAGDGGTATAGNYGTAIAGDCGKAQVGAGGMINIKYWDGKRYRKLIGYAGENIEADVMYKVENGKFVKVDK